MSRIIEDKNGSYDLSQVCRITRVPQISNPGGGLAPLEAPALARLHFESGDTANLQLPYQDIFTQWKNVKKLEGHPADTREDSESPLLSDPTEHRPS